MRLNDRVRPRVSSRVQCKNKYRLFILSHTPEGTGKVSARDELGMKNGGELLSLWCSCQTLHYTMNTHAITA